MIGLLKDCKGTKLRYSVSRTRVVGCNGSSVFTRARAARNLRPRSLSSSQVGTRRLSLVRRMCTHTRYTQVKVVLNFPFSRRRIVLRTNRVSARARTQMAGYAAAVSAEKLSIYLCSIQHIEQYENSHIHICQDSLIQTDKLRPRIQINKWRLKLLKNAAITHQDI